MNTLEVLLFCINSLVKIKKANKLGKTIFAQTSNPLNVESIYGFGLIATTNIAIKMIKQNIIW